METGIFSRHGRHLIASLTLVTIAMMAAAGWYYLRQRAAIEAAMIQELAAISEIKVEQIRNWRSERLGDGRVLASSPMMSIARRALSGRIIEPADRDGLLDVMRSLENAFLYTGATLVDRNGNIRLQSNPGASDPARIRELAQAAARGPDVALEDLYWDAKSERPLMALSVPIGSVGALILTIDPARFLYPFMSSWPVPSATAETLLFRREGDKILYLNNLRHRQGTALRFQSPWRESMLAGNGDTNSGSISKLPDYRGVTVLQIVRSIPDSPWYLTGKIDTSEVDAPVSRLGWEMALIVALIALANVAGAGFIWRDSQIRSYREREVWFRHVANETPAYLWMTSPDGKNSFVNKPLAEFLGTTKERVGGEWIAYFHPDDVVRMFGRFSACVANRSEFVDEYRLRRFDGEYRWFAGKGLPRFSSEGEFLGYAGSLFDVTERRNAEQSEHESAELVQGQNRVLELLARNAPLPETLDLLVRVIEALSPDMLGSILLLDPDGLHLRHGAAPSLPEAYTRAVDGEPIGAAAGSCGTAAFRREAVFVEDIASDPLWENYRQFALEHGLRACWSTPIFEEHFEEQGSEQRNLLGTFALYFRSPGLPGPRHRKLIEMATQTAAIAIIRNSETQALRASEERLRLAATSASLGIWEWEIHTGRLIWSDDLKAIFDWPKRPGNLTIDMVFDVIHPDDREPVQAALDRALAQHADFSHEYRIRTGDGSLRWIGAQGRAQYDAGGLPRRMIGVARDITRRKHAEEEISRREAQLVEAQRIAHLGSFEWDVRAERVYRSAELCNIFGVSAGEFEPVFESYLKWVHPEDRSSSQATLERAFRECRPFDFEHRIVRPDGSVRVLRSQGHWLCDNSGSPAKLTGICQDITVRKQAEQELLSANAALAEELKKRARAEKEIQALSARLINAHEEERARLARELHDDLGQQIAAVSIGVSNLKRGIPAELSGPHEQSERIRKTLVHLAGSIRHLSHELHPATLQHCAIDTALRAYCSEFAARAAIKVPFESSGSFDSVPPAIALCVYRVTQEALQNVAKHAGTDQAAVALRRSAGNLTLTVSDSGIGMDLNGSGMARGLGLISIKERTRLVNGTVDIQSQPHQGTALTVTLPVPG